MEESERESEKTPDEEEKLLEANWCELTSVQLLIFISDWSIIAIFRPFNIVQVEAEVDNEKARRKE